MEEKDRHSLGDALEHFPLIFWSWIITMMLCLISFFFVYVFILGSYSASLEQAAEIIHYNREKISFYMIHNLVLASGVLVVLVSLILFWELIVKGRLMFDRKPWTPMEWSAIRVEANRILEQNERSINNKLH